MEDLKIFIYEKLKLNNQSQLTQKNICDVYDGHSDSFKYKNTEIIFYNSLKTNLGNDSINKLIKTIGIIIDNVASLYRLDISATFTYTTLIKISCYSETYEYSDHHDSRLFLGNILIRYSCLNNANGGNCLTGLGVEFKKRDPRLFSSASPNDKKIINELVSFIQPENKKFKIYQ